MISLEKSHIARGERIKFVRKDVLGLKSQEEFARLISSQGKPVSRGAVGNWEIGKDVHVDNLISISKVANVELKWLIDGDEALKPQTQFNKRREKWEPFFRELNEQIGQEQLKPVEIPTNGVPIIGKVAASSWIDVSEMDFNEEHIEFIPAYLGYPPQMQFGLVIQGECLNKLAPSGSILTCLSLVKSGVSFQDGDLVVVERRKYQGQMVERTAKRVRKTATGYELWPESTDPAHQAPIILDGSSSEEEIEVVGKVLLISMTP